MPTLTAARRDVTRSAASWLTLFLAGWLAAVYLPVAGTGFLRDDFAWLRQAGLSGPGDLLKIFGSHTGFYRPLVTLSFAVNRLLSGLDPLAYGLTNLALLGCVAAAVAGVARAMGLPTFAALVAAAVWSLNPHGINMAVLWVSGRTSLLLTLFSLLAAMAVLRGHRWRAAALVLMAMLSKEEAVLLPAMLFAVAWLAKRGAGDGHTVPGEPAERGSFSWRDSLRTCWPLLLALVPYLILRAASGAFWTSNAPSYYRPSLSPAVLGANAVEYADRTATFAAALVALVWLGVRHRPAWSRQDGRRMAAGLTWLAGGLALTVTLPVRSSLYACFPSVGTAFAAAVFIAALLRAEPARTLRALVVMAVLLTAAIPVHRSRNRRWTAPASTSAAVMAEFQRLGPSWPPSAAVVIHDVSTGRANVRAAFATLLPDALALATRRTDLVGWIEPPPDGWEGAGWRRPEPGAARIDLELRNGRLVPATQQTGSSRRQAPASSR